MTVSGMKFIAFAAAPQPVILVVPFGAHVILSLRYRIERLAPTL